MADIGMGGYTAHIRGYYRLLAHPTSLPGQCHPTPKMGFWCPEAAVVEILTPGVAWKRQSPKGALGEGCAFYHS